MHHAAPFQDFHPLYEDYVSPKRRTISATDAAAIGYIYIASWNTQMRTSSQWGANYPRSVIDALNERKCKMQHEPSEYSHCKSTLTLTFAPYE